MLPNVSVIVTTFNRSNYLRECIKSILNQEYVDFELIVVDNFSSYDFLGLLGEFEDLRVRGFQNSNYGIIAINRNFGIEKSVGKYLAFCDDDDVWLPNKLEEQMKVVQKNQVGDEPIIVHTNTILFGDDRKESISYTKSISKFDDFFSGNPLTYSSVLLSNSEWVYFDENPAKRASEDADLWINLYLNKYQVFLINEPLVRYRIALSSASRVNMSFSYLRYLYVIINAILIYKIRNFSTSKFAILIIKSFFKFWLRKFQNK
jgi:teichuronic acid biosynthesis glycosyltransferase TuaG